MTWTQEFLQWCEHSREVSREQAEMLESGQLKLLHNNVNVSPDAAARHRRNIAELDGLILKVKGDLLKVKGDLNRA